MPYGADCSGNDDLFIREIIICGKTVENSSKHAQYCPIAINGLKNDGLSYYDKCDVELTSSFLKGYGDPL